MHCSLVLFPVNGREVLPSPYQTTTQMSVSEKSVHNNQRNDDQQYHQHESPQRALSDQTHEKIKMNKSAMLTMSPESVNSKSEIFTTNPGQFQLISNKEVSPGHVTMIGFTTPIVKVGEPVPLEQFLSQDPRFSYSNGPKLAKMIQPKPDIFVPVSSIEPKDNIKESSGSQPKFAKYQSMKAMPDSAPYYPDPHAPVTGKLRFTEQSIFKLDIDFSSISNC